MTSTSIIAVGTVGILLLLSIVTVQLVQTLKQTRQTARTLEQYLVGTRPKVEEVVDQLGSVLGRIDNIVAATEKGAGRLGVLSGPAGSLASALNSVVRTFATFATLAGGISQVFSILTPRRATKVRPSKGDSSHE